MTSEPNAAPRRTAPVRHALAFVAMTALCSACGGDAAPPEGAEGAVGLVEQDNAGAAENPVTPALSGGPAGQTPDYGSPGGAPSMVVSSGDGAPASTGSENPPFASESGGADAASQVPKK
jgi:hypothetical protein